MGRVAVASRSGCYTARGRDCPSSIYPEDYRKEFNTAVNPKTNLGSCFRCERNYNPIDFVIEVQACNFREAIAYLSPLLPPPRRVSEA